MEVEKCDCCSNSDKGTKKNFPTRKDEVLVTHVLEKIRSSESVAQLENGHQETTKEDKEPQVEKDVAKPNDQQDKSETAKETSAPAKGEKVEESSQTNEEKEKGTAPISPLATFFKDWDKFTNDQKIDIEKFIRDKAERMANFPKVLTVPDKERRWRKKIYKRNRRKKAYKWWKWEEKRKEQALPQGRVVKEENINENIQSVVTLTLDNSKRPELPQSNKKTRTHLGDRDRERYPSYRYSYRERRFDWRRSSRRRKDNATMDGFVTHGRRGHPRPTSLTNGFHMGHSAPVEQLMRQMEQLMRLVSSMPAPPIWNAFPKPLENRRLPLLPDPPPGYYLSSSRFSTGSNHATYKR